MEPVDKSWRKFALVMKFLSHRMCQVRNWNVLKSCDGEIIWGNRVFWLSRIDSRTNEPNRKVKEYSIDGWLQKVPFNQSLHILRKYQNVHTLHWPSKIILSLMVWRILWKVECLQELTLNQSQRFFKALHFFLN